MTRNDWISIFLCAIAAALCGVGSSLSAPMFCVSSVFVITHDIFLFPRTRLALSSDSDDLVVDHARRHEDLDLVADLRYNNNVR